MATIKLSEWCNKSGVSYITAYRWFKADKFPVYAFQTETGTILVEDDEQSTEERVEKEQANNDAMASFFKKTVEFSKANMAVEDFAAYVASNFNLEIKHTQVEKTTWAKASRVKPAPAEAQNHFQKFLQKPNKKPAPNMFLMDEQTLNEISNADTGSFMNSELADKLRGANVLEQPVDQSIGDKPEVSALASDMQKQISVPAIKSGLATSGFPGDADIKEPEFTMTYDEARELVDLMVQAKMVDDNMLVIDRQAKEICKWPPSAAEALKAHLVEMLDLKDKKATRKGKK